MSDARPETPARTHEETELRHIERIETEIARHRQNGLWVRLGGLSLTAGFIALHGLSSTPRYMFLAPMLAAAAWGLDAHAAWNVEALRALARVVRGEAPLRVPALSLDVTPVREMASWRRAFLSPARALLYHPLLTVAAIVAVDAPRLDPDGFPTEWMWYVAVVLGAFATLALATWSWWYDRYGSAAPPAQRPAAFPPLIASAPRELNAPQNPPVVIPRAERTRPFGTAIFEGDVSDAYKKVGT